MKETIKQKVKKYEEMGFMQTIGTSDKEFVKRTEQIMINEVIDCLEHIKNHEDFKITREYNKRKKYPHRIIIDIKSEK